MNELLAKAIALGASVAGFVPARLLRDCPSAQRAGPQGLARDSGSVIVLGLYHSTDHPEMDWWEEGRSTPGDRMLYGITTALSQWLCELHGREAHDIPYAVSDGGIYLKDAAVLAGLGMFGRNNLVIVPGFGPRIRFRALWADLDVEKPQVREYLPPCGECSRPCQNHCPQQAFPHGNYSRERCLSRMDADKASVSLRTSDTTKKEQVRHCRNCELCCVYSE
jgi:epoxyqueuosine reductase